MSSTFSVALVNGWGYQFDCGYHCPQLMLNCPPLNYTCILNAVMICSLLVRTQLQRQTNLPRLSTRGIISIQMWLSLSTINFELFTFKLHLYFTLDSLPNLKKKCTSYFSFSTTQMCTIWAEQDLVCSASSHSFL